VSHISSAFNQTGHKALIPYVTVGYPSLEATLKIVPLLANNGCDIVELGIPFSDPLADGATIQKASFHALENGTTIKDCLEVARQLSRTVKIPLVFMTYFNPVFSYGLEKFIKAGADGGVSGLIIPDLPPEEGEALGAIARRQDIDIIYLLSPTSTAARIKLVAEKSRGFIYLVSVAGVTGARKDLPPDLAAFVNRVRKVTKQPLSVGFGISTTEQAKQVAQIADGVIIGSRLIQLMEADESMTTAVNFIREMRKALD